MLPENFKNAPAPHRFVINRPDKVGGENSIRDITDLGGSGSLSVTGEANFFRLSASATLKNGSAYFKTDVSSDICTDWGTDLRAYTGPDNCAHGRTNLGTHCGPNKCPHKDSDAQPDSLPDECTDG